MSHVLKCGTVAGMAVNVGKPNSQSRIRVACIIEHKKIVSGDSDTRGK